MKEGLFYQDGSFQTRDQISNRLQLADVVHRTLLRDVASRGFDEWTDILIRRQKERELLSIKNHASIVIPSEVPITLVLFGDTHAGSEAVDYKRLKEEIDYVRDTPNTYALALGDLVDGFFWGGATQGADIANFQEQDLYMSSALRELKGKLLVAWGGDHDHDWQERTGNSMYSRFENEIGAHFMHGVGYLNLKVGEQEYKISGAHRHNGFSVYNHAHAGIRLLLDDAEGGDIFITAHNHRKAIDMQTVKEFGGTAREVYFLALGTYKQNDNYARKKGFSDQATEQMGSTALVLDPKERKIKPIWNILRGT